MKGKVSIKTNIAIVVVLCVVLVAIVVGVLGSYGVRRAGNTAMERYETAVGKDSVDMVKGQIQTLTALLEAEYARVQAGVLTEEEAKQEAMLIIGAMRYNDDGSGYFWVNDTEGVLLLNKENLENIGRDQSNDADLNGVCVMEKINESIKNEQGGANLFAFEKNEKGEMVNILVYSKLFKPWGWIVSTGIATNGVRAELDATEESISEIIREFGMQQIVLLIVLLAVFIFVAYRFGRSLETPILKVAGYAKEIAQGKIDASIQPVEGTNEVAILHNSFVDMVANIQQQAMVIHSIAQGDLDVEIIPKSNEDVVGNALATLLKDNNSVFRKFTTVSSEIRNESGQIAAASQSLAQGSSEQASAIEQITTSVNDIAEMSQINAGKVNKVWDIVVETRTHADSGNQKMKEMLLAMQAIGEASSNIKKVNKAIDDIAFNTNILALNAAVEASRAGEQGKGFAVVAEEVRNLAEKSTQAAQQTEEMIEDCIQKTRIGSLLAEDTEKALQLIADSIEKITELSQDVAQASSEQADAASKINHALNQVSCVVQTNSAASEECAAASEQLSSHAIELSDQMVRFRLKR